MADFCNFCIQEMFGDNTIPPDIDVYKEFDGIQIDYYKGVGLCEGCGLVAVYRTIDDELKVCYNDGYDPETGLANIKRPWVEYTNRFLTIKDK